jgi:hypothetical protein
MNCNDFTALPPARGAGRLLAIQGLPKNYVRILTNNTPEVVVIALGGGRVRTRESGQGTGVQATNQCGIHARLPLKPCGGNRFVDWSDLIKVRLAL